jgi:sterol desaturase/sphingolipid hydroxylase (fatty acid hydroxylase superfamily)
LALIVIIGSLLAVGLWEWCRPRRSGEFPPLRRRLGNIGIWLLNVVLAGLTFASPDSFRVQFEATFGVALPTWPLAEQWLSLAAAFLLLDFLHYAAHRCQHALPWLWRFHALHHSDPDVDVTTSVRHHPIEYLIAGGFYWLAVLALGIPVAVVTVHAVAVFAAAGITHGNVWFPQWLERALQPVAVTLDLHLIHHSVEYKEANSNFGAVLSVWDRLFGTFTPAPRTRVEHVRFGVRELPQADCLKISGMLRTPWRLRRAAAGAAS